MSSSKQTYTKPKLLVLYALWNKVKSLALGGIKYSYEVEIRWQGISPIALVTQKVGLKGEVQVSGVNRFASKRATRIFYYILLMQLLLRSVRIIKRENVDAVVSLGVGWINDITALLVSIITGKKLFMVFYHWPYNGYSAHEIFTSLRAQGRGFLGAALGTMDRWFAIRALMRSAKVFTLSEMSKETLTNMGVKPERIEIAQPGVDDIFFMKSDMDTNRRHYDAIVVSRISPEKGIYDLVDIWAKVVKVQSNRVLYIFGHPTKELDKWLRYINSKGVDKNIKYLGTVSADKLKNALDSSKVFLFPSHMEGFGIAIAEAMASSLPVVCYDIRPMNEIFNSKGVFFIKEGDYDSFAETALKLLNNHHIREEAGMLNQEFAQRFNWRLASEYIESTILKEIGSGS